MYQELLTGVRNTDLQVFSKNKLERQLSQSSNSISSDLKDFHFKIPHEVTILWRESENVVTILLPVCNTSHWLQIHVSMPPWFTVLEYKPVISDQLEMGPVFITSKLILCGTSTCTYLIYLIMQNL